MRSESTGIVLNLYHDMGDSKREKILLEIFTTS